MEEGHERRRFFVTAGVTVLATGLFAAWLVFEVGGETSVRYVDDLATVVAAFTATVLCLRAGASQAGRPRLFWWLLAGAAGAWTLAEILWAVYDLALAQEVPVPSWADVGYLSAIPLAVAALVCHPALHGGRVRKARSVLDGLGVATALLFLSWMLVLGPLWRSADLSTLGGVVSLAYPFGDVVIVFFIVLTIRGMRRGNRLALWCLLGGLLATALSDSVYAYLTQVKSYDTGNVIDTGWFLGYLGIALGALSSDARSEVADKAGWSPPTLAQLVVPFLPILLALSVAAIQIEVEHRLDDAAWMMAFALVTLVLVRQGLLLLELAAPGEAREVSLVDRLEHAALGFEVPETSSHEPPPLEPAERLPR